jgi:hypothetical protein
MRLLVFGSANYDEEMWAALCACGLPIAFIAIIVLAIIK